jgi:hypothetical protein
MTEKRLADEAAQKHHYRLFITVESILLVIAVLGCAGALSHVVGEWAKWPLTALWMWHIVAIPICFLYLIGKPVVMTLSPLIPSAESRKFWRQLNERPPLKDEEFYARYYEGSGIPRDIPARLRRSLLDLDPLLDRAIPTDFLYLLDDELDFADVLYLIEREFDLRFTETDHKRLDGTLDNLIRLIHSRTMC